MGFYVCGQIFKNGLKSLCQLITNNQLGTCEDGHLIQRNRTRHIMMILYDLNCIFNGRDADFIGYMCLSQFWVFKFS